MSRRARWLVLSFLLAAAICPYFIDLDGSSIWDANEAFYVETPREMIERGDYISPSFNYEPRFNKPVLSYWIVAAAYQLFGVSVGVQRLPIAIGGTVLIVVAFFLARVAESGAPGGGRAMEASLWAAVGLAVAPRLLMFARRIFIDIYISMFMALTLLFFAAAERYPDRRRLFLLLMYVSVGLGMLTKGPVAAVLPAITFALYLGAHRELRRIREMSVVTGAVIVFGIVAPWYVELYHRYGWTYITSFFMGENVDRFTSGIGVQVSRGLWFYSPVVPSDSFPIAMYLIPAAVLWSRDRKRQATTPDPAFRIRTLLWLWILVIVGFFSVSAAKQDLYIFPIVPAVAALGGIAIARVTHGIGSDSEGRIVVPATTAATAALLVMLGAGLLYLFHTGGSVYVVGGVVAIGTVAISGGVLALALAARADPAVPAIAVLAAILLLDWVFVLRTLPSFEKYKPAPAFAALLRDRASRNDVVATYDVALPSLVYYLKRHVVELFDRDAFNALLASDRGVYVVLGADDYEASRERLTTATCVIDRRPTFEVKLKNVLAREPLPELVIITNRCSGAPVASRGGGS